MTDEEKRRRGLAGQVPGLDNVPMPGGQGGQMDPRMLAFMQMFQPQPQQQVGGGGMDLAALFGAMRNDPQADRNRAYAPGVNNEANPFSTGFFNNSASQMSPTARLSLQGNSAMNQMAQAGAFPDIDVAALQGFNQQRKQQFNPIGMQSTGREVADPFNEQGQILPGVDAGNLTSPFSYMPPQNPTIRRIPGGGQEGMVNPYLPDAQRYGDANFFGASPTVGLPPGAFAGDERTNYFRETMSPVGARPKKKKKSDNPFAY